MGIDPTAKLSSTHPNGKRIEKWALRAAFDDPEDPWLPPEVLWRQKEQFSDGVGYSWIDTVREQADASIADAELEQAVEVFPHNPPQTKEALFYRRIFAEHFPHADAAETVPGGPSIACSTPAAIAWDAAFQSLADPSGRAVLDVHADAWEG